MRKPPTLLAIVGMTLCLCACSAPSSSSSAVSEQSEGAQIGYIQNAYTENGVGVIAIDLGEGFFINQEAGKAIREDNPDCAKGSLDATCQPPHGWYLRNKDTTVSTFPVSNEVEIQIETLQWKFEDLVNLFSYSERDWKNIPFWVTVTDGKIIKIQEQFIP